MGDGELKEELHALARSRPQQHVRFLPFANQSEIPSRYLLADIFALPSRSLYETWGLAVNEAMHLGVPCLVSDLVGCQRDLVLPGETGWVFPANDPAALAPALEQALHALPQTRCSRLRRNVAEKILGYTYAQKPPPACWPRFRVWRERNDPDPLS